MTSSTLTLDGFAGRLLQPSDDEYDVARRIWNGAVDRRPAFIARCTRTADVAAAVRFAVRHGLLVAVRGGGHSIPGHSLCDGGLVVDLSLMRSVEVDADRRLAHVLPGALLSDLDGATQVHGLATPGGEISHTGVAGLTLGGGVGWLSRMFGLACDSLVSAELVTAEGEVLEVAEDTEPDLLWGLRGGGGNFGVVTRFTFRLHPVSPLLLAGAVMVPLVEGRAALTRYAELCGEAPDELSLTAACLVAPPLPFVPLHLQGQHVVVLGMAWLGDPADGEVWARRLRDLRPAVDLLGVMPYTVLQSMLDDAVPHGLGYYVKSEWMKDLDDAAIGAILDAARTSPGFRNQILLRQMGGAVARVPADATAFSYRQADFLLTIAGCWEPKSEEPEPHRSWARTLWEETRRVSAGGAYVNQIDGDEGLERVRAAYSAATWERLVALKRRVDPDNVFRLNQNVEPAW